MPWRIGEILIQKKLIDWDQLQAALADQAKTKKLTGEILIEKQILSKALLFGALAQQYDMQFVDPEKVQNNPKAADCIPRSIAEKYRLLPLDIRDEVLYLGIADPRQSWPEEELDQLMGVRKIKTVLCLPEAIQSSLQVLYGQAASN